MRENVNYTPDKDTSDIKKKIFLKTLFIFRGEERDKERETHIDV